MLAMAMPSRVCNRLRQKAKNQVQNKIVTRACHVVYQSAAQIKTACARHIDIISRFKKTSGTDRSERDGCTKGTVHRCG